MPIGVGGMEGLGFMGLGLGFGVKMESAASPAPCLAGPVFGRPEFELELELELGCG